VRGVLKIGVALASRRECRVKAFVVVALVIAGNACAFAQDAAPQAKIVDKPVDRSLDKSAKPGSAPPTRLNAEHRGPQTSVTSAPLRPEFQDRWSAKSYYTRVRIDPLQAKGS
jgi:hypothetical protein